jgi:hypothetical protein
MFAESKIGTAPLELVWLARSVLDCSDEVTCTISVNEDGVACTKFGK